MPNSRTEGPRTAASRGATEITERVADRAQSTFENAKGTITDQFGAVARAIESAARTLEQEQHSGLAKRAQQYVRKAEDASQYLRDKSPRELKDDLDRFARRRPAWFLGGAFVAGMLGARFLKSSERKAESEKGAVQYAGT